MSRERAINGRIYAIILVIFHSLILANATSVLVIHPPHVPGKPQQFAKFYDLLKDQDCKVTTQSSSDPVIRFIKPDSIIYDNVIYIADSKDPQFKLALLLEYVIAGGNLILAVGTHINESLRDVAFEIGVEFPPNGHVLSDLAHLNQPLNLKGSSWAKDSEVILQDMSRWIPHKYSDHFPKPGKLALLRSSSTSIIIPESAESSHVQALGDFAVGSDAKLVSILQTRNNARVAIVSSHELFSETSLAKKGNDNFVRLLSSWTLKKVGLLRLSFFEHFLADDPFREERNVYTVEEKLTVQVQFAKWEGSIWEDFVPNDAQFEAVMLDPWVRKDLKSEPGSSKLTCTFTIPDRIGVFTFRIDYRRPFWEYVTSEHLVTIRGRRHDQQERLLLAALPYNVAAGSLIVAFMAILWGWITQWGFIEQNEK